MEVRPLAPVEAPTAARALARAFRDDPVMGWCFPDDRRRAATLERGFELFLRRIWLPHERCFTDSELAGVAGWLPPGHWRLSPRRRIALLPALLRNTGRRAPRFVRLVALVESKHPREPHWYLPVLGVEPGSQGRGLGSRLMFPMLERCDRDRLPAYLEASTPRNRALYERHGFQVTEELQLPRGGPPIWLMWREPGRR